MPEQKPFGRASKQAAEIVFRHELERAERQAEERSRRRIVAIPSSRRYRHRVGDVEIEVIDAAAAVAEAIKVAS
jgi:hypothetical protein